MNFEIKTGGTSAERVGVQLPNFPPFRQGRYTLEIEARNPPESGLHFEPLRPCSGSGQTLAVWELLCKTTSGHVAGGCALSFPPRGNLPSPKQAPHPILGEWLSALRCTRLSWVECGPFYIAAGFPEEGIAEHLWEGLMRLLRRNGTSFLVGAEPAGSLVLDMALRRGARVLEPFQPVSAPQYFFYVDP